MIKITDKISISENELTFKASRSSGPGGQNINKVNTRVTLFFNVLNCKSFSDLQKQRILWRLSMRCDKNGVIRIASQKFRSQIENRKAVVERLQKLLKDALKIHPVRKKTKIPYAAKQKRLQRKKQRSLLKQQRSKKDWIKNGIN